MGDKKNLHSTEAIEKIKELAADKMCHFCTFTAPYQIHARPMSTIAVDNRGDIYFFSARSSSKNSEVNQNNKVQLLYGDPGAASYMSVEGEAVVITERGKIEEMYKPIVKAWFQGGTSDPEISLIKVTPADAYYWDTQHGKVVSFLKIIASVVTGKTMDDGVEGNLRVS